MSKGKSPPSPCGRIVEPSRGLARLFRAGGVPPLAVLLVMVGCGGEPQARQASEPILEESAYDGLTPDEIRLQATSMTLEEAERLGIVDTTIRIEVPISADSLLILPQESGG